MSDIGARLRVLFEEIAEPIDIRRAMDSREVVVAQRLGWLIAVAAAVATLFVGFGVWFSLTRPIGGPAVTVTAPSTTSTIHPLTPTGVAVMSPSDVAFLKIRADDSGSIWALGNAGLTRFEPATGDSRVWTLADDEIFAGLVGLAPARDTGVWLWWSPEGSLGSYVGRFDGGASIQIIEMPGPVIALAEATDGVLWAAVEGRGVLRWDGSTWATTAIRSIEDYSVLAPDHSGGMWVSGGAGPLLPADSDLWHFDGVRWTSYPDRDLGTAPGAVDAVVPLPDGVVLLDSGADRLHLLEDGTWIDLPVPALSGDRGFMLVTVDGDIWVSSASDEGEVQAARLRGETWTTYGAQQGLPEEGGVVIADLTATDRMVYLGIGSRLMQLADDHWIEAVPGGRSGFPTSLDPMLAVSYDELWGADWADVWHYADGAWQLFTSAEGLPTGAEVRDLALATGGTVWAATDRGLAYFADPGWVVVDHAATGAVAASPDGDVWVAQEGIWDSGRLVTLEPAADTWKVTRAVEHPLDVVDSLAVGTDGSVWISSHGTGWTLPGRGMARFDGTAWRIIDHLGTYRIAMVGDLAVAPNGDIWTIVVDEHDGTPLVVQYDGADWIRHDGVLEGADFDSYHRVWVSPDGTVNVPAPGGLATFDGDRWELREGEWWDAVSIAPDGTVWVSGSPGVMRLPGG